VRLAIWRALGDEYARWWDDLVVLAFTLLPPVTAVVLGARSGRTGNRLGAFASAIGAAWLTFVVMFYVGANYLWAGEPGTGPDVLAVSIALVVGGVEGALVRKSGHHPA
jgi:hypothetical protein